MFIFQYRHNGTENDDGKSGSGQNPLRAQEND